MPASIDGISTTSPKTASIGPNSTNSVTETRTASFDSLPGIDDIVTASASRA